jgi:hypothetical protein
MAYNAKNYVESKGMGLPADTILDGVIVVIEDKQVKDFISESAKAGWKGDIESSAINVEVELMVGEPKTSIKIHQMFSYFDKEGKTGYTSNSNLGKYVAKYKKMPEIGDQVKIITDSSGFGKIKLN